MAKQNRPWVPLLLALTMLPLCLVACQAPSSADPRGKAKPIVVSTAVGGNSSAVPTLSPLTIGIWTSNTGSETPTPATQTPTAQQTIRITIFILCMLQDSAHGGTIGPATNLQVHVHLTGPVTQSYTGTTDNGGLAQMRATFTDAHPSKPISVNVTTSWHGATYQGQTFLILGDEGTPSPSPSPSVSPTAPTGTDPTPTTGPDPTATTEPTATTAPDPTAAAGP